MGGAARGSGTEDLAAPASLRGRGRARLRARGGAGLSDAVRVVDLRHQGISGAIGATFLGGPEPALVDPGPSTTLPALEAGLAELGVVLRDLRHLCLTHVHLDHAGAAGHLAERLPALTIHVHEDGAAHMADPTRLVASARRLFGDAFDALWGEVRPVPADRIRPWRPGERGPLAWLRALATPGHIAHHVSYLDERDGTLCAGDALGILLHADGPLHPATPPPGIDLGAWSTSLDTLAAVGAERAVWTHFGEHAEPGRRIEEMRAALAALEARVAAALSDGSADEDALRFEEEVRRRMAVHLPREQVNRYFETFGAAADYAGVRRYLEKASAREPGSSPD